MGEKIYIEIGNSVSEAHRLIAKVIKEKMGCRILGSGVIDPARNFPGGLESKGEDNCSSETELEMQSNFLSFRGDDPWRL